MEKAVRSKCNRSGPKQYSPPSAQQFPMLPKEGSERASCRKYRYQSMGAKLAAKRSGGNDNPIVGNANHPVVGWNRHWAERAIHGIEHGRRGVSNFRYDSAATPARASMKILTSPALLPVNCTASTVSLNRYFTIADLSRTRQIHKR